MKCRRSKSSRGARLRGARLHEAAHQPAARKRAEAAAPAGTAPEAATPAHAGHPVDSNYCPVSELRVDGPSKGAIDFAGMVIVGRDGHVAGPINARLIVVEGTVEGDLRGDESVRLAASARVSGNVVAPRISVARGARLAGRIATQRRPAAAADELDDSAVAELLTSA
jgi:cytoskeletal protein CcmA (bactofilin family)